MSPASPPRDCFTTQAGLISEPTKDLQMIHWGKSRAPILAFIERWSFRIGLAIIALMGLSFIRFVAEYYQLRSPL